MTPKPIALIFEVSHGCQMSCAGCRVDTTATSMPSAESMAKLLGLFDDFEAHGTPFSEIELGPTDLMSSSNRSAIFESPEVRYLARKFQLTTLAASFAYPHAEDYAQFADQVNALTPDNEITLAVPTELRHVFNDKYIERIQANIAVFQRALGRPIKETILNVIFDERYLTSQDGAKHTYEDLFSRVHSLRVHQNTKVDFTLHHGRSGAISNPLTAQAFRRSVHELNRHYLRDLRERRLEIEARHVPFQLMHEACGGELVYHAGHLYTRPVLNERVTVIDPVMRFEGPWTAENYYTELYRRLHQNLNIAGTLPDCTGCEHVVACAQKSLHQLIKLTHRRSCITLLREHGGFPGVEDEHDLHKLSPEDFQAFY